MGSVVVNVAEEGEKKMSKEKVKNLNGVFTSVFAHAGYISKAEAQEISGLLDHEFEATYSRASDIAEKVMNHQGNKMDKFMEHFAEEIDHWMGDYGGKLFH